METAILRGLLEITIYSAALFLGVLLFRRALYKWLSPALRYALWFLVILRLIVPVTFESSVHLITLPQEAPPALALAATAPPFAQAMPVDGDAPQFDGGTQPAAPTARPAQQPQATAPAKAVWRPSWQQWLLLLWAIGFAAVMSVRIVTSVQLERRIRQLGRSPGPAALHLCERICADLGIRARLPVFSLPDLTSPALTAQFRPKLLLPETLATDAPHEQLVFSLLHELMHFKRRDHLVCMLLTLLGAIWWFNPIVWLLPKYLRIDMESACDAQAVTKLDPEQRLRYANLLLELGQR